MANEGIAFEASNDGKKSRQRRMCLFISVQTEATYGKRLEQYPINVITIQEAY